MDKNRLSLLELLKVGLWRKADANLNADYNLSEDVDWDGMYQLAQEKSILGLVLAGVERSDVKPPKELLLQWIGEVQVIEQQNRAMNQFVAELVEKMRAADIDAILVKGQGVAQCYEKPMWRPSGDVDLLLSEVSYKKAKELLLPLSSGHKNEERYSQHLGMNIGQWYVEIHGSLRTGVSSKIDRMVDAAQDSVFMSGNVRSWQNGGTLVSLPAPTEDVFLIFTHFIKHFYKGGMSLRQLCDWCRLLWTYRAEIKVDWLEQHLRNGGLMIEWKAFAALAVVYLGMPAEAMPFINLNDNVELNMKAERLMELLLGGYSGNRVKDTLRIAKIFPWKTLRYSPSIFLNVNWLKVRERIIEKNR